MRHATAAALMVAVGLASACTAEVNTRIDWQASLDGVNFEPWVNATIPGTTVHIRAVVSYTGTASPIGLASMVFQPTISNWSPEHTLLPFVNGGMGGNTSTPLGVVTDPQSGTQFGRLSPWGRTALSATSFIRGHTHANPTGNGTPYLRIAQNQVTSWIGGTGNTTGGSGVLLAQLSDVGRTAIDPAFNGSLQSVEVFRMGIVVGSAFQAMVVDSPMLGFGNFHQPSGERQVYWFGSMTEVTGSIRGTALVTQATIFVPGPGALCVLAAGAGIAARRRRVRP